MYILLTFINKFCRRHDHWVRFAFLLASLFMAGAIELSPDDLSWRSSVESAIAGTTISFYPGIYLGCNVAVPTGVTLAAKHSLPCPPGTFKEDTTSQTCKACATNATSPPSTQESLCFCNAGFSGDATKSCNPCMAGKFRRSAFSSANCTSCEAGKYAEALGAVTCTNCPAGKYQGITGSSSCKACAANASGPVGSTEVGTCFCNAGFFGDGIASCTSCTINADSLAGSKDVGACFCRAGFFGNGTISCDACQSGAVSWLRYRHGFDLSNAICQKSFEGRWTYVQEWHGRPAYTNADRSKFLFYSTPSWVLSFQLGVLSLKAYTSSNSPDVSGIDSVWQERCDGAYKSTSLSLQTYVSAAFGALECSSCEAGKYSFSASTCALCPTGKYQEIPGSSSCQACIANTSSPAGSTKVGACICNAGFFGDGITSCTSCTTNANSLAGSVSESACFCSVGFFWTSTSCEACTAGKFSLEPYGVDTNENCAFWAGQGDCGTAWMLSNCQRSCQIPSRQPCSPCSAGTYAEAAKASACATCPVNTYQNSEGASACLPCLANSSSLTGSTNVGACFCSAGFFGDGVTSCEACTEGTFSDASFVADAHVNCAFWAGQGDCGTAWMLSNCQQSCQVPSRQPCSLCSAGTYAEAAKASACADCPADTYQNTNGATACSLCLADSRSLAGSVEVGACFCNAGFFGDGNTGCMSCLANLSSPAGSINASACYCKSGYFGNAASCRSCEPGKYTNGFISVSNCSSCPAGTFANLSGSSSCIDCPAGKYQGMTGSTDCMACLSPSTSSSASTSPDDCTTDVVLDCKSGARYVAYVVT